MTAFRATLFVAFVLLVGIAAFASVPPREAGAHALLPAAEGARIREHLLGAERMMRAADVAHLSAVQRANRARAIELLRGYREAGIFPHNHDFPDRRVPVFVDAHGTSCAMAHLIAEMGGEALVERVAATANNAYVRDLAADPAFLGWLERNGMTVAEAARVQPWYGPIGGGGTLVDGVDDEYAIGSALVTGAEGLAVGLQLSGGASTWESVLGLGAGLTGVLVGLDRTGRSGGDGTIAALNLAFGGLTIAYSGWNLLRGDEPDAATADGGESRAEGPPALRASPVLGLRHGALSAGMSLTF